MIQLTHHINEKLVTIGLWFNSSLDLKLLFHFNKKCHWIWLKVHSHSNAPLKFLGRFGVFENAELNTQCVQLFRVLKFCTYLMLYYTECVRRGWEAMDGYVSRLLSLSLSLSSHTHTKPGSLLSRTVSLSLSFSLVLVLILGCCMLGCCVFVRSGTNMER
jgi:hypothetical protein